MYVSRAVALAGGVGAGSPHDVSRAFLFLVFAPNQAFVVFRGQAGCAVPVGKQLFHADGFFRGAFLFEFQIAFLAFAVAVVRFVGLGLLIGGDDAFVVPQHDLVAPQETT